jgi:hypothetical protein
MNQHIETLETLAQQYEDVGVLHVRDSLRAAITLMREQSDWVVADHHVLKRYESHCTWVRRWCGLSYEDQTAAHEALAAYRGQSPELSVMAQMLMDDMALAIKQLAAIALMRGQSEPAVWQVRLLDVETGSVVHDWRNTNKQTYELAGGQPHQGAQLRCEYRALCVIPASPKDPADEQ